MSPLPEVVIGSNEPLYNIGVVSRMTGISMATLRAWERRYDFPESERTAGGHRLYSEKDVLRLRWVKERIDEGMQTAQAINALRHQETIGRLTPTLSYSSPEEALAMTGTHLEIYRPRLMDALTRGDTNAADMVLSEALVLSNPEDLILDVINPVLSFIGEAWAEGKINVADEHFATNYLRQRLLMWMVGGPPARSEPKIILACAPSEWHEGSLLMLGALLRRRRWPVAYLGQAVPLTDLAGFIHEIHPAIVVLAAMMETTALELADWPQFLPDVAQSGKPVIGFGGRIFIDRPEWRTRVAGIYLGDDLRSAVDHIEKLM